MAKATAAGAVAPSVQNQDIMQIVSYLDRFIIEVVYSTSAAVSGMLPKDAERLDSFVETLKAFKEWVITQDPVDFQETWPNELPVPPLEVHPKIGNEALTVVVRMFVAMRGEMLASDSVLMHSGLQPKDAARFDEMIARLEEFISGFMAEHAELDLPKSSPKVELAGPGR